MDYWIPKKEYQAQNKIVKVMEMYSVKCKRQVIRELIRQNMEMGTEFLLYYFALVIQITYL